MVVDPEKHINIVFIGFENDTAIGFVDPYRPQVLSWAAVIFS